MPLRRLPILQHLLDTMPIRHMPALLHRRPGHHPLLPLLQMREFVQLDPGPPGRRHPPPMRNIRNRALAADQIAGRALGQVFVQDAVEAARLVLVSLHAVVDSLRGVAVEVVGLALHGAHAGVEKEEPVVDFVGLAGAFGVGDVVVRVVLLDEVLHDGAGFEEADGAAVGEGVG